MKKIGVLFGMIMATGMLMAGGDMTPTLSNVAEVPVKSCNENKIYLERDAELMWQDQAYTEAENGAYKRHKSIGKAGTHGYATSYCSRLDYAGFTDWRLPTSDELTNVHNKVGQVFTYFRDSDFWSSTPTIENKYYVVFPADAIRYARPSSQTNFIRCVRCTAND